MDDGRFELDLDSFRHASEGVTMSWEDGEPVIGPLWSPQLEEALGPARQKDADLTDRDRDLAASLQALYEEDFFHRVGWPQKRTGLKTLCLAGGCAMNSVANGMLFRGSGFRDVFIQSAAGDAGTSIGAAQYVWHSVLGKPRQFVMEHSYLTRVTRLTPTAKRSICRRCWRILATRSRTSSSTRRWRSTSGR